MWSLQLIEARRKVSILEKVLSMHKTGIDLTSTLTADMASLKRSFMLPSTLHECNTALRRAKRDVTNIIATSFEVRDTERMEQIAELEAAPDSQNRKKAKILRNLKKAEEMKQLFLKLQLLRQVRQSRGITRIEVPLIQDQDPKQCTEWKTIDVPTEILQHLLTRNRKHFGQAHNTPFTTSPLLDDLGFTGSTDAANEILQGTYNTSELSPHLKLLIAHLQREEGCNNNHQSRSVIQDAD
jgi:hypothetical protein